MRLFVSMLFILFLAVIAGLVIVKDPGYFLLSWGHWSVEMPLWLGALGFFFCLFLFYVLLRFINSLTSSASGFQHWMLQRRRQRAHRHMCRGLVELTEGHWNQARKYLIDSAKYSDTPLINYLAAARAAHALGELDQQEEYLRKAYDCAPHAKIAIGLTQANLQLEQGKLEQAAATLSHLRSLSPHHEYILLKLKQVYTELKDWKRLFELLPAFKKHKLITPAEQEAYEYAYYQGQLRGEGLVDSLEEYQARWGNIPRKVRKITKLILDYVVLLCEHNGDAIAENLLRTTLKHHWDERLVEAYGEVKGDADQQLAFAEELLKGHEHSALLLRVVGEFSIRRQLWGKAEQSLQFSLRLESNPRAYTALADLYIERGEKEKALELLRSYF